MDKLMLTLILLMLVALPASTAPLHSFDDVSVWKDNADGGNAPEISADTEFTRDGGAMRIVYTDKTPHWGNITAACQVPPDARALRLWVYKHDAAMGAAMHIWLFEPDGDAWSQRIRFGDKDMADLSPGWYETRVPVAGFNYDPRGDKQRGMVDVDRILIGCNFGDLEVTVDDMTWETGTAGQALPLPRTDDLTIERGELGSIGILDMGNGLPDDFRTAHSPEALCEALRAGEFGATVLRPGDLADADTLTVDNFDAIILPFGPNFPQDAREAFLAYLRAGGSFLATDGYAFDAPRVLTDAGWSTIGPEVTAAEMNQPGPKDVDTRINTRAGKPGDALSLHPSQIGVFDPQFPLEHATALRLTDWYANPATLGEGFARDAAQRELPEYNFAEPLSGFSASGLTGVNSPVFPAVYRRWIPVLQAFDTSAGADPSPANLRGTALSIMHNYAGEYAGSSWAFSGLTDGTDVFLADAKRQALLTRVLRDITEKAFLHNLTTNLACYEPGETATITVQVTNRGRKPVSRTAMVTVGDGTVLERELTLAPGETRAIEAEVDIDELAPDYDFVPISAALADGQRIADQMESGFCIRNEAVLASGPKVAWEDNYLTVGGRPTFMVGTNQTGMMYFSDNENPAIWDRDFRTMGERNYHIMRILHFSPYSKGGYEGRPTNNPLDLVNRPEKFVRQMDAIVQLAQKHRVAIFLALHDWMGTVLTDEELAVQADWNRFWVERYREVPGIFYDVQNEPSVAAIDRPDVVALWNAFLKDLYGTDEALRAAWEKNPPEAAMPNVPLGQTTNDWYDTRSADRKRFETELLNRWVKANVDPVHEADPDAPICVGYLPSMPPADKILGVKHTDFSNMHYYGPPERMPIEVKIIDRGFLGKGFSLGEFGARAAHDRRVNGSFGVPVDQSIYRFSTFVHYAAGLGGAFIANWDWKDFDESVFPWGLMHHGSNITKPWLHTLEQAALLLSLAEPVYESPEVFVLAPDSNRVGPMFNEMHSALGRSVELLLDQRVNFGTVNEEDIDQLPESAKALVWPLPYCPADETFARVLDWVKAGGTLYLSGDIAFDRTRQPTRAARRAELCLPEFEAKSPFDTAQERWGEPIIEATVGAGKVLFAPYPLELKSDASQGEVYARLIELSGVDHVATLAPDDAPVRVFSIPTAQGGHLYTLARTTEGNDALRVTLSADGIPPVTLDLVDRGCAFVLTGPEGQVIAAESQGEILIGSDRIAAADDYFGVCALDGKDLRESGQVLVLPHQCETVTLDLVPSPGASRCYVGMPTGVGEPLSDFRRTLRFSPGTPGQVAVIAAEKDMDAALKHLRNQLELRF